MKPKFLEEMEEAFAVRQHVLLTLNTEDRFCFPEQGIRPSNLNYFIASHFCSHGYRVAQYLPSMGVRELSPSRDHSQAVSRLSSENDPIVILNSLATLLRDPQERWIVLVLHPERIAPSHGAAAASSQQGVPFAEILHTLMMDDGIAAGSSRIVLVTYSGMPDDLLVRSRGCRVVAVGLPSFEERLAFIEFLEDLGHDGEREFGDIEEGLPKEELARLTTGMPLYGIEAAFRASTHLETPLSREGIRLAKAREIRNLARDLLEVSEPEEGFEGVAGLSSIKSFFCDLIPQIRAGRPGVPQAVLLQGVPGCGKSHLVHALSKELGWPLLELRNVRSPFVGQSEMNLEHVIRVVEQLQPAVLFFDEIDQSIGQRGTGVSGDSGTSERMLARIFTWLGSLHMRGRLLFVGATNRPDLLDVALLDRFGVSIPFLKPCLEELLALVPLILRRFERKLDCLDAGEVSRILRTKSPTGRDVQEMLVDAGLRADRENGRMGAAIEKRHIQAAAENVIGRENEVEMTFIALISLSLCSFQSLLPWNDFKGLRIGAEIPEVLIEKGIVREDGRLDRNRIQEAIDELRERRHMERALR